MRKKLLMAIALLVSGVGNLWADDIFKDVTSIYLTNADFEGTYSEKSGSGVNSDRAIYEPYGWTVNYTNSWTNDCSALDSDSKQWNFFKDYSKPSSGGNKNYWIRLHSSRSNQQLELSQTKTLPLGSYKVSADYFKAGSGGDGYIFVNSTTQNGSSSENWITVEISFTSDGTSSTKLGCRAVHTNSYNKIYAFDNFKLEWNLNQSLKDLIAAANKFLTDEGDSEGTSYTALKSAIDAAFAVKESDNASTLETQYGLLEAALNLAKNHRKPWLAAKATAQEAIDNTTDYGNVVGVEKTNLQSEIAAAEPSSADDYDTAKDNLVTKTSDFTGAKANYDDLVTEIAKAKALGIADDTADGFAATSTSTSATALASTKSLKEYEYTYVTANYSFPLTLAAGDWAATTITEENTNNWDGTTGKYKSSNGYSSSYWSCSFSQTFDLPAGDYIFKVAGRRSSNSSMWIEVKNGDTPLGTTANDFPKASSGLGINTSGATDFATGEGHTYANSGNGYGWEWRYVKFHLDEKTTVTVAIKGSAGVSSQWINFSGYQVLATNALNVSLYEYFKALNKAIAERDLPANANIDGKEKADLLAAINADGTLDKESTTDVDDATTALTSATTAFTADGVKTAYDNLVTSISNAQGIVDASINVGNGAFQIPESAKSTLSGAITTASDIKNNSSKTYSDASSAKTTLDGAVTTYNGTILNAPTAGVQYRIKSTAAAGKSWKDKYYMMRPDESATPANGGYLTKADVAEAADYLAIAWIFTSVSDNTYKMSLIDAEGNERYLCTNIKGYGEGSATQIRTTTDDTKALVVKVVATTGTNGRWFLQNTEDDSYLGGQDEGLYSNSQNYDLAIETAAKASVGVNISAGKYATRIFPFTPTLPTAVKAYSCEASVDSKLTLVEVAGPAANTPYILYSEEGYSGDDLTGYGTATEDSYQAGWLTGVYTIGSDVPVGSYVLQTQDDKQAFYIVEGTFKTKAAYRCYLTVPGDPVKAFFFDNDETAVSSVKADELQGATIYNLAGQRVSKAQKGVYIINGKKVAVK